MSCEFEFPQSFPSGCVAEVITGLRNGTLLDNPRRAIRPVMAVINYGIGIAADDGPPVIGSTPIESDAQLADALEQASFVCAEQADGAPVKALPIPWVILTPILVKLVEKLLERLANR